MDYPKYQLLIQAIQRGRGKLVSSGLEVLEIDKDYNLVQLSKSAFHSLADTDIILRGRINIYALCGDEHTRPLRKRAAEGLATRMEKNKQYFVPPIWVILDQVADSSAFVYNNDPRAVVCSLSFLVVDGNHRIWGLRSLKSGGNAMVPFVLTRTLSRVERKEVGLMSNKATTDVVKAAFLQLFYLVCELLKINELGFLEENCGHKKPVIIALSHYFEFHVRADAKDVSQLPSSFTSAVLHMAGYQEQASSEVVSRTDDGTGDATVITAVFGFLEAQKQGMEGEVLLPAFITVTLLLVFTINLSVTH